MKSVIDINDRVFDRRRARIYLAQARIFKARGIDDFWKTLLIWARHARQDSASYSQQRALFPS